MKLTGTEVGLTTSAYVTGAMVGALLFGWLTDQPDRKKLFTIIVDAERWSLEEVAAGLRRVSLYPRRNLT